MMSILDTKMPEEVMKSNEEKLAQSIIEITRLVDAMKVLDTL